MIIYCITNKINGKRYIGQTIKTIEERWYHHKYEAQFCQRHNRRMRYFQSAIIKYGEENFEIEILETLEEHSFDLLNEREIYYIKSLSPEYNISPGGGSMSFKRSKETKDKISTNKKGSVWLYDPETLEEVQTKNIELYPNYILGRSPQTKHGGRRGKYDAERSHKISLGNMGKTPWNLGLTHTSLSKDKMSESSKRRFRSSPGTFKGKKHTETTKEKISLRRNKFKWLVSKAETEPQLIEHLVNWCKGTFDNPASAISSFRNHGKYKDWLAIKII